MNYRTLPLALLLTAACSGGDAKPDPTPTTADQLAECQAQAAIADKQAELFANVSTGSVEAMQAAYTDFVRIARAWEADDAPCVREGSNVTERMAIQRATKQKLSEAETAGTTKMVKFLEPNTDGARELLKTIFASGRTLNDTVIDAVVAIDRNYRQRLLTYFKESGKYGQLGAPEQTTCIFGDAEIDPNAEEITENFRSTFKGGTTVHALCRIPIPAENFAGDDAGQMVLVLDDDDDPSNGTLHEAKLGTPEQWGTSQLFKGRFSMPQGAAAQADAAYFTVHVVAKRPTLGDEWLVSNHFYWYR